MRIRDRLSLASSNISSVAVTSPHVEPINLSGETDCSANPDNDENRREEMRQEFREYLGLSSETSTSSNANNCSAYSGQADCSAVSEDSSAHRINSGCDNAHNSWFAAGLPAPPKGLVPFPTDGQYDPVLSGIYIRPGVAAIV